MGARNAVIFAGLLMDGFYIDGNEFLSRGKVRGASTCARNVKDPIRRIVKKESKQRRETLFRLKKMRCKTAYKLTHGQKSGSGFNTLILITTKNLPLQ